MVGTVAVYARPEIVQPAATRRAMPVVMVIAAASLSLPSVVGSSRKTARGHRLGPTPHPATTAARPTAPAPPVGCLLTLTSPWPAPIPGSGRLESFRTCQLQWVAGGGPGYRSSGVCGKPCHGQLRDVLATGRPRPHTAVAAARRSWRLVGGACNAGLNFRLLLLRWSQPGNSG
jgi:hypothetical protein